MRRTSHASSSSCLAEFVAERFLSQGLSTSASDEGKIATRAGGERGRKYRQDRQGDLDSEAALFGVEGSDTIPHMLTSQAHGVTATKPGIHEHIEPHTLSCSNGPARLVGGNLILGPNLEATGVGNTRVCNV